MEAVFSWLLLFIAGLFLLRYLGDIWQLRRIASWPQTTGELSHCRLEDEKKRYQLSVQYQYQVDEQAYVSDVIQSPCDTAPIFSKKVRHFYYRLVRAFESHEPITVFYNPHDPNQSVLYRSRSIRLYIYSALIALVILGHLLAIYS